MRLGKIGTSEWTNEAQLCKYPEGRSEEKTHRDYRACDLENKICYLTSRDWKVWRKTWQDIKSRTKSKVSGMRRHERATGGGPPIEDDISKSDEDIINIVKVVSIEGHNETTESAVDFDFDALEKTNDEIIVEEELTTAEGKEMLRHRHKL
ncbi:hypothetical protein JTB14_015578 [Gonioctena quinquepunctata]|nr:hypothetical protein JTB14_015578 [Gonioctena quinquepunctata]